MSAQDKPVRVRLAAIRDWLAFQIVALAPHWMNYRGGGWRDRLFLALLPYAGAWAYRDHDFGSGEREL